MGATLYIEEAMGTNVKELFNQLVEEAKNNYGDNSYNGSISTTKLGRKVNFSNEENEKDIYQSSKFFPEKRQTNYSETGIDHYKAFTPKWVKEEVSPKKEKGVRQVQKFSVMLTKYASKQTKRYMAENSFDTLTEAKQKAKEMALIFEQDVTIKKHRSNGEMFEIGKFELISDGKKYKSSRKSKSKVYKPVKKYMFFVFAAE